VDRRKLFLWPIYTLCDGPISVLSDRLPILCRHYDLQRRLGRPSRESRSASDARRADDVARSCFEY